jgi:hypothetical protein
MNKEAYSHGYPNELIMTILCHICMFFEVIYIFYLIGVCHCNSTLLNYGPKLVRLLEINQTGSTPPLVNGLVISYSSNC